MPSQTSLPHQIKFNKKECLYVKNEIDKLLKMEVSMEIDLENVEFFFDYISETKTQWGI